MHIQYFYTHIFFSCYIQTEWLISTNRSADFEELPTEILAGILRQFFGAVRKKDKTPYSKSGMINIRSGLNQYLQSPPNNRIINLMRNDAFQNSNKVFTGRMRKNKEDGLDVSRPHEPLEQEDMNKLYDQYFIPGVQRGDTEILQQKVCFDLIYYTGRRGKEGLRAIQKNYFEVKTNAEGIEYIEVVVNEKSKRCQGHETSTRG